MRAASDGRDVRRVEWGWALPRVVALFLVARLIVVICAAAAEWLAAPSAAGPAGSLLRATDRPILASLTSWDAVYYLGIARDGYQAGPVNGPYPETVFFPLYPALTAVVGRALHGDLALGAVLVANGGALIGLWGAFCLARRRLSRHGALLATCLVAIGPGSVAFAMAYADGPFLALVTLALLAAERGGVKCRTAVAILSLLAGLTRLQGAFLCVPLLWLFARQDGGRPRWSWLAALGGPAGLVAYSASSGLLTGDATSVIRAQAAWDVGVVSGAVAEGWVVVVAAVLYGVTGLAELRLLWDRWRGGPDASGVLWGVTNAAALVFARRVASLPRYMAPVTQIAEQVAGGGYSGRAVRIVLASSVLAYGALALLHFSLKLAP